MLSVTLTDSVVCGSGKHSEAGLCRQRRNRNAFIQSRACGSLGSGETMFRGDFFFLMYLLLKKVAIAIASQRQEAVKN